MAALAGQQLAVHRLLDQGMPERILSDAGQQHIGSHRRPQRPGKRGGIQPRHRGQQPVADQWAACASNPEHLLGRFRQPPHAAHQQVA